MYTSYALLLIGLLCVVPGWCTHYRHPENNMFWQYLNFTVKRDVTQEECIVCSLFPHDGGTPYVYTPARDNYTTINMTWVRGEWGTFNQAKVFLRHHLDPNSGFSVHWDLRMQYPICFWRYSGNGTEPDREAQNDCTTDTDGAEQCVELQGNQTSHWEQGLDPVRCNHTINLAIDSAGRITFNQERPLWIPDWYWDCGNGQLWLYLPKLQRGRCALVRIETSLTLFSKQFPSLARRKRSTSALNDLEVPEEHQLVSEGTRFVEILFPNFGVGNILRQLNKVHYRLAVFVNNTILAVDGIKQELTALRLMATQNRMALDALLAKEGGFCVLISEYCCTYIPPNDSPGGNISQALQKMHDVADQLRHDESPNYGWGFLHSLFGMFTPYLTMLVPVCICLLLVCVFGPCILRCLMNRIWVLASSFSKPRYTRLPSASVDDYGPKNTSCGYIRR